MESKKSKVYTRTGDRGMTSLIGGKRIPKYDLRIEAYGTVDELMAHVAYLMDLVENSEIKLQLLKVLDKLMIASSILACDISPLPAGIPEIIPEDILFLERSIDDMDQELPELSSFILPGGDICSSQSHIVRTICRRTERIVLKLSEEEPMNDLVLTYLNRLSDYFFLLSRRLVKISGANEIPWNQ